jgi:POT family proton-dependent oligopeptide transporter
MSVTLDKSTTQEGQPKGLYLLFTTEMWERFSYYGNRALLSLFMTKALLLDKATASNWYGNYTFLAYATPLIGGYIADHYWGNRRSVVVGGLLMALAQFILFISASNYQNPDVAMPLFFLGLGVLVIGNGFFKPNISSMVGTLYPPSDSRIDGAYTIFYMGINIGAFLGNSICSLVGDTGSPADFRWGFLSACIGMILGVISFVTFKNKYIVNHIGEQIGVEPNKVTEKANNVKAGKAETSSLSKVETERIGVILIVAFFVIVFWGAFEQAGISLTFFADEKVDRHIFGWEAPPSIFQILNPICIILLAPPLTAVWLMLNKRGIEPPSPLKMAIGLFCVGLGYIVIAFQVQGLQEGEKVALIWLVIMYALHTTGELCLSPIGLALVNKLSPVRLASLMMAVWFLSSAAGNKLAGTLSSYYPEAGKATSFFGYQVSSLYDFFMLFFYVSMVAAAIVFILYRPLVRMMHQDNK